MTEINSIANSLEQTIKNSDLQNVTISLAEAIMDSLMGDGVVKDIPIIGTIVGLGKGTIGIKEHLFLKKIIFFISELKDIPPSKRFEMIEKINCSGNFRIKVGEKLLYIIDKCDDHEKSQITARLFSAFLSEKINYDEFLRAAHIIEGLMAEDLKWFLNNGWEHEDEWEEYDRWNYEDGYLRIDDVGNIATSGLFEIISPEIRIEDQWDHKATEKYIVEGSELSVRITDIGKKIKEILENFYIKNEKKKKK